MICVHNGMGTGVLQRGGGRGWVDSVANCRSWGWVVGWGWGWEERECLFQAASKANGRQSNFLWFHQDTVLDAGALGNAERTGHWPLTQTCKKHVLCAYTLTCSTNFFTNRLGSVVLAFFWFPWFPLNTQFCTEYLGRNIIVCQLINSVNSLYLLLCLLLMQIADFFLKAIYLNSKIIFYNGLKLSMYVLPSFYTLNNVYHINICYHYISISPGIFYLTIMTLTWWCWC